MAVSKKDFVAIADILRAHKADHATISDFCTYFRSENPGFDAYRFNEYIKRA